MEQKGVAVRFVLSGACHPYSGRQVMFNVDLYPGMTVRDMINRFVVPNWPQELPELEKKISPTSVKLLKMGRAVDMNREISTLLTSEEVMRASALDNDSRIASAILFHLVFIPNEHVSQEPPMCVSSSYTQPHSSGERSQRQQEPPKASTGCCLVM